MIVVDEETNRVNLEFLISEGPELIVPEVGGIPLKPVEKQAKPNGVENGIGNGLENGIGKKRAREDDENLEFRKKARVAVEGESSNDVIIIDEDEDTVMID